MGMAKTAVDSRAEPAARRSQSRRVLLVVAMALILSWGVWTLWKNRRYRRDMAEIKTEIQAGRHGHAARKLEMLLAWKPDSGEAAYLLGVCEKARGQAQAAFHAWERVSPGSPFSARAIQGRMQLLIERGRLTDAEKLIIQATADPRFDGSEVPLFLGLVYSLQGRVEEAERIIESCWNHLNDVGEGGSERAILLVRLHIQLWLKPPAIEEIRSFLDQVARSASEDDRGWLGKAKLATRVGTYDEAARWLDACLRRRPDDIPIWRARLDWALATHRLADVRQALGRLPVEDSTPAEVQRLSAWLAAFRGDLEKERQALERLVAINPADFNALDRLLAIAQNEDEADRADELRRQKAEVERLRARYEKLYKRNQTIRDAREMARLAEHLGQSFEAKVLRTIAMATDSEYRDSIDRASQNVPVTDPQRGTLAELLAQELAAAGRTTTR
jgi:tetratricopeptide (TPR) repeat protein